MDTEEFERELEKALSPNYLLVRRLGTGGMGSVYIAREPALKRLVAVKLLAPELAGIPGFRARFQREAQAVAQLSHPNIVAVHAVGELEDGTPYFVMQYVSGRSMRSRIEHDGPLDVDQARRVIGEVASALAAAHKQGIIHRDIKPANILFDDDSGRALVSDFGIAAVRPSAEGEQDTRLTATGMAVGTPQYMSPEQLLADEVTDRTDVYALGLLGYELLTGSGPFQATSPQELVAAHLRDVPPPLSDRREDVDPELAGVITACLEKDAARRPTAAEVAKRLLPGEGTLLEWPPPGLETLHGRLPRVTARLWVGGLSIGLCALAMIAAGPGIAAPTESLTTSAIWLLGLVGTGVLAWALKALIALGNDMGRALGFGFGWLTVAETLADRRGDAGRLISGMREYSILDDRGRSALRKNRVVREVVSLVGGVLPVPSLLLLGWVASTGRVSPAVAPWVLLGPPLLALFVSAWLEYVELRAVGRARKRLSAGRAPTEGVQHLVEPWYETFEAARRVQPLGRGATGRPLVARAVGGGIAVLVVCAALISLPVAVPGVIASLNMRNIAVPDFSRVEDRILLAEAVRHWGVPPDSSITSLEAGRALYTLLQEPPGSRFPMHPVPRQIDAQWSVLRDTNAFGARLSVIADSLWYRGVGGFTQEETAYLERVASHPGLRELRTVARAAEVDFLGGAFVLPFPDSLSIWDFPIPRLASAREAAYGNVASALLSFSRGRLDEAETRLRETISYGLKVLDGHSLIEGLVGAVIVGIGRHNLEHFYRASGRDADARALRGAYEAALAANETREAARAPLRSRRPATASEVRQAINRIVADSTRPRVSRWEMSSWIAMQSCENIRDLLFGPNAQARAVVERVRTELPRTPSEEAFLEFALRPPKLEPSGSLKTAFYRLAQLSGAVLGNERVPQCTGVWLSVM
ncbi:MAG: protein kinase [Gemmatimonadales bacterium]